ncbi:MAG: linked oxidase-like protein [Acidobacteria bacterium]|nr:linked oxidase-like protein [Acidobacteriota bacterium]
MAREILDIDGVPVGHEVFPESAEELAQLMKEAHGAGACMIPIGAGTQLKFGNPPRAADLAVHTARLQGVVEYEPANLTVSARAGTPLRHLQEILRAENQFLPLDPPHAGRATLGGIVACASSGPIRFRYGTVRDMLIGIRVVHADGTPTKSGGKLVKNVSGYDMCKLYAGSLGTLGITTELTFRVHPVPRATATLSFGFPSPETAFAATQALIHADLAPDALEALNQDAFVSLQGDARGAPWVLLLRLSETEEAVRWQVDRARKLAAASQGEDLCVLEAAKSETFWQRAAGLREVPPGEDVLVLKCPALCQTAVETERRLRDLGSRLGARTLVFCHAGTWILYGRYEFASGSCDAARLRQGIADLRQECIASGGHVIVESAPAGVKRGLDTWGYEGSALELMRRIKAQFDPAGLLNPGRFVGGI